MPHGGGGGGPAWPGQGLAPRAGMGTALSGYAASVWTTQGARRFLCLERRTRRGTVPSDLLHARGLGGPVKAEEPSHHTGRVREWWHEVASLSLTQRQPR